MQRDSPIISLLQEIGQANLLNPIQRLVTAERQVQADRFSFLHGKPHEIAPCGGVFAKTPAGAEIFSIPCRTIGAMSWSFTEVRVTSAVPVRISHASASTFAKARTRKLARLKPNYEFTRSRQLVCCTRSSQWGSGRV